MFSLRRGTLQIDWEAYIMLAFQPELPLPVGLVTPSEHQRPQLSQIQRCIASLCWDTFALGEGGEGRKRIHPIDTQIMMRVTMQSNPFEADC